MTAASNQFKTHVKSEILIDFGLVIVFLQDLTGGHLGTLRLKRALQVDGVIRGLHEVSKYVEACKAQVVFLAESCSWARPGHGRHGMPWFLLPRTDYKGAAEVDL